MQNMILDCVSRCDEDETELEFTVQGRKVIGVFPAENNTAIYQQIKQILINTYLNKIYLKWAFFDTFCVV